MTPRQSALVSFIETYQVEHGGVSPTFDEMAEGLGLAGKGNVHRMIELLEVEGILVRGAGRSRDIRVVRPDASLRGASDAALIAEVRRRNLTVEGAL